MELKLYALPVTATAGSNTFVVDQTITSGNFTKLFGLGGGSNVYTTGCAKGQRPTFTMGSDGKVKATFAAKSAGTYYLVVKSDATSVQGQPVPSPSTVHYAVSTEGVAKSSSGIDLSRPPVASHQTKHLSRFFWRLRR